MATKSKLRKHDIRRKEPSRTPADCILIVVEGRQTEKNYFIDLRKVERLTSIKVVVLNSAQSNPVGIVDYAKKVIENGTETISPKSFEYVYTVFDHDGRVAQYREAIALAKNLDKTYKTAQKNEIRFIPIPSNPCFELWFLLHFQKIHPHEISQREVIKSLKKVWPEYKKNESATYQKTRHKLKEALVRAKDLRSKCGASEKDAVTHVDLLVKKLCKRN